MKIERSSALGRDIRRDRAEELGTATWTGVKEAIRAGRADEALAGLDYACHEARAMHDSAVSFADDVLTHLAEVAGEDEVYKLLRSRYDPVVRQWLAATPDARNSVERGVEFQRGHFGVTSVKEEEDRFVVTCDPCGSGGRLRRTKQVGRAQQAHDWTWNKPDVPYYCTHCAVMGEILPTEIRGYPIRINLPPEKDSDPCVHLYYKHPEAIPDEYFRRIGRSREVKPAPLQFVPNAVARSRNDER